jgi:hypothetical protein
LRVAEPTLLLLALFLSFKAEAETAPPPPTRHFEIGRATSAIRADGVLDEAAWAGALTFDLPYEWSPGENVHAPVKTEFLVTYDDQNLYAAWRAFDPDPSTIRAHLMERDAVASLDQDDYVAMTIDTFNDRRRGFQFRVNPLGVQADAIFSEQDGKENFSFDMIWSSAGRITDSGYVVEIIIPLDQLRFPGTTGEQTWGFNVERAYPRNVLHRLASASRDRSRSCVLCSVDQITGFANLRPGWNLELSPTLTAVRTESAEILPAARLSTREQEVDPGLSVRWGVTPSMSLNLAVNPDFSQVEADAAQLEVNERFALQYPEKRPFFLEAADIFATPVKAVFTRTIVDLDWGFKVTGKQGRNAFGVFHTDDKLNALLFPSNQSSSSVLLPDSVEDSVVRYRRDLGAGSMIGALYTGRRGNDYENHVFGLDSFLRFNDSDTLKLQALGSRTGYPSGIDADFDQAQDSFSGRTYFLDYDHLTRSWFWTLSYLDHSPGFRADSGFVPRVDIRDMRGVLQRQFWGDSDDLYSNINVGVYAKRVEDYRGQLTDQEIELYGNASGPLQSRVELHMQRLATFFKGTLYSDLNRIDGELQIQPSGLARLSVFVDYGDAIDFANNQLADLIEVTPAAELKLGRHINTNLKHTFRRLRVDRGELLQAQLSQLRLSYNLNTRIATRVIVQRLAIERNQPLFSNPAQGHDEDELFTQALLSYILNAQTVFFLGYSDQAQDVQDLALERKNRTFFFKIGYGLMM